MSLLLERLRKATHVSVVSHIDPDGDAIGSVLALTEAIQQLGVSATAVLSSPIPELFHFLAVTSIKPSIPENTDLCIVVDLSDTMRTGFSDQVKKFAENESLICIDHHPTGDLDRLSFLLIKKPISSTCELLFSLLGELSIRISPSIATSLLTGIYTDTGGFQYSNTTSTTLDISAELMRRGGRLDKISSSITHSKSIAGLKLLGIALSRAQTTRTNTLLISLLTYDEIHAHGAALQDVHGIIGELSTANSTQAVLFIYEFEKGLIKGSLRTSNQSSLEIGHLAELLGGGGHPRAAGFSLAGSIFLNDMTWKILAKQPNNR